MWWYSLLDFIISSLPGMQVEIFSGVKTVHRNQSSLPGSSSLFPNFLPQFHFSSFQYSFSDISTVILIFSSFRLPLPHFSLSHSFPTISQVLFQVPKGYNETQKTPDIVSLIFCTSGENGGGKKDKIQICKKSHEITLHKLIDDLGWEGIRMLQMG